jgi:hypothetical protein
MVSHKERGRGGGHDSYGDSMRRRCGVELRRRRRKVMTGGAHLSARHGEGRRRREVRCFPVWEAAIQQGTTDARSAGTRGRDGPAERPRPSGEGGGEGRWKRKEDGPQLGRKGGLAKSDRKNLFRIKFDF